MGVSLPKSNLIFLKNCLDKWVHFKLVDEHGTAVILKNNTPRYLVIDFSKAERERGASAEDVMAVSEKLIQQNMEAYEVLAK